MYKWKAEWGRNDNFIMVFKPSEDLLNVKEEFFYYNKWVLPWTCVDVSQVCIDGILS